MTTNDIPIWMDAGIDDLFVGKVQITDSPAKALLFTVADAKIVEYIEELVLAGKVKSFGFVMELHDPEKPQTPEQIEYIEKAMKYGFKPSEKPRSLDEGLKTPEEWMFHLRRAWNYEAGGRENERMSEQDFLSYMESCVGFEVFPPASAWERVSDGPE